MVMRIVAVNNMFWNPLKPRDLGAGLINVLFSNHDWNYDTLALVGVKREGTDCILLTTFPAQFFLRYCTFFISMWNISVFFRAKE